MAFALALLLGCEDRHPVTLQLSTAGSCVRTSLACGGEVGIIVADGTTDEVLDARCVPFAADPGLTLEKLPAVLAALDPPLGTLAPGRSVVLEVAAYSPATGKGCPRYSASASNNAAVPSYFGRSAVTKVGAAASIGVSLQCFPSECLPCTKFAVPGPAPEVPASDGGALDAGTHDAKAPDAVTDARIDEGPSGDGSAGAPYRSIGKLLSSLAAGQTGCLTEGTYVEDVTFPKGGSGASPITLAAAPGARAVVKGVLTVPDNADNVAIANLVLEGSKTASPLIRGDHVALRGNDITNAGADCITLGELGFGTAKSALVEANRIHGCRTGVVGRFAESSVVAHNFIFDNTGDGVAFFPNGDSFVVEHNVLDGNGSGVQFGADTKVVSTNDTVRFNVISNSTKGFGIYSAYPGVLGTGNAATSNCLWMNAKGDVAMPPKGFSVKDNITGDPMFADRTAKDFRLAPAGPCAGLGPLR